MSLTRHFTAADLATMPDDGKRYEVVRGELLVTPSPALRHQVIARRLVVALNSYLSASGLEDQLLIAPADVTYAYDTVVEPDLFVADTAAALRSDDLADITTLHLAIEIISPSSARADRTIKRQLYQEQGVPQYWIVDGEQRQVEVWDPNASAPLIEAVRLAWRHPALDERCEIDLVTLFDFGQ